MDEYIQSQSSTTQSSDLGAFHGSKLAKQSSSGSPAIVASSSSSTWSSSIGSSGSCASWLSTGSGGLLELVDVVVGLIGLCCFAVCCRLLSLVPVLIGARLCPRGDSSRGGVVVPAAWLELVAVECLDRDLSVDVGVLI